MFFLDRLKVDTLLRLIEKRKDLIYLIMMSYWKITLGYFPDWNIEAEFVNDKILNEYYKKLDKMAVVRHYRRHKVCG